MNDLVYLDVATDIDGTLVQRAGRVQQGKMEEIPRVPISRDQQGVIHVGHKKGAHTYRGREKRLGGMRTAGNRVRLIAQAYSPVFVHTALPDADELGLLRTLLHNFFDRVSETSAELKIPCQQIKRSGRRKPTYFLFSEESLGIERLKDDSLASALLSFGRIGEKVSALIEVDDTDVGAMLFVNDAIDVYIPKPTVAADERRAENVLPIEQAAAARRASLSKDWPNAAEVSKQLGSKAENGSHYATRMRREGRLLGVYVPGAPSCYRFPTWQFKVKGKSKGEVVDYFYEILQVLREDGKFLDSNRRTTGWGEVEWFMSRHEALESKKPVDLLQADASSVLQAAIAEFRGDE